MRLLRPHMSSASGYYKTIRSALDLGMDCVQLFTKNFDKPVAKIGVILRNTDQDSLAKQQVD